MIKINLPGRLGNNLTTYAFARIVAEESRLKMDHNSGEFESHRNFPNAIFVNGEVRDNCVILSGESNDDNLLNEALSITEDGKGLYLHGYFQNFRFYMPYREKLKKWLSTDIPNHKVNDRDWILHIRREDYLAAKSQLGLDYYDSILHENRSRDDKVTIVGKDLEPWVIEHFKSKYGAFHYSKSSIEEFCMIRSHSNIICSNSTYSWWASFLSDAMKIYVPEPETGYWSKSQLQKLQAPGFHTIIYNDNRNAP